MAPLITEVIVAESSTGNRVRSLSGASALLGRRFRRNSATPRPTASRSESTNTASAKRRATVAAATSNQQTAHIRIVPSIEDPSRSLIFDIVDRELEVGSVIKIGRYSERHTNINCMSFKSKVVSRCHCEVWTETDGKVYIRDTKSSSGTFLNHVRLSPAGNESRAVQLNDGDIVQLGVDFQGGIEEMYRSVKMKFELNRSRRTRPLSFNLTAFQNLRNLRQPLVPPSAEVSENEPSEQIEQQIPDDCNHDHTSTDTPIAINKEINVINNTISTNHKTHQVEQSNEDLEECCICLYALAPFQALFVSPCSHTYHYKCIRPLLQSYPGFQCPICRTYSDLEASVATEDDEVPDTCKNQQNTAPLVDSEVCLTSSQDQSRVIVDEPEELPERDQFSNVYQEPLQVITTCSTAAYNLAYDSTFESLPEESPSSVNDHSINSLNQEEAEESEDSFVDAHISDTSSRNNDGSQPQQTKRRERRSSQFMEKLKMVFFEKRKSSAATPLQQNKQRKHNNMNRNRPRPVSYPNILSSTELGNEQVPPVPAGTSTSGRIVDEPGTSCMQLDPSLSRETTSHLNDMTNNYPSEAMVTDD